MSEDEKGNGLIKVGLTQLALFCRGRRKSARRNCRKKFNKSGEFHPHPKSNCVTPISIAIMAHMNQCCPQNRHFSNCWSKVVNTFAIAFQDAKLSAPRKTEVKDNHDGIRTSTVKGR
ncbi:MAG: hypothetical protein NZ805_06805 [Armatimonadetes bacterium]|nr:hypothetical protein [Armatimonadota bacterium]MDW8028423.1 hypothetical protein [Armatimonadota bacterium]